MVLVGDPRQLVATVQAQRCVEVGYSRSMFERLMKNGFPVMASALCKCRGFFFCDVLVLSRCICSTCSIVCIRLFPCGPDTTCTTGDSKTARTWRAPRISASGIAHTSPQTVRAQRTRLSPQARQPKSRGLSALFRRFASSISNRWSAVSFLMTSRC